jgi:hypothetical protein
MCLIPRPGEIMIAREREREREREVDDVLDLEPA